MEKVDFTFKGGRVRPMNKKLAEVLGRMGHGTYLTRDLVAGRDFTAPTIQSSFHQDDLDSKEKDELHAIAKERGIAIHHMAGAEKVRAALREQST